MEYAQVLTEQISDSPARLILRSAAGRRAHVERARGNQFLRECRRGPMQQRPMAPDVIARVAKDKPILLFMPLSRSRTLQKIEYSLEFPLKPGDAAVVCKA